MSLLSDQLISFSAEPELAPKLADFNVDNLNANFINFFYCWLQLLQSLKPSESSVGTSTQCQSNNTNAPAAIVTTKNTENVPAAKRKKAKVNTPTEMLTSDIPEKTYTEEVEEPTPGAAGKENLQENNVDCRPSEKVRKHLMQVEEEFIKNAILVADFADRVNELMLTGSEMNKKWMAHILALSEWSEFEGDLGMRPKMPDVNDEDA
ncbi:hypothetical protein VNI00_017576 [Paramarasmius palmivorus]|uniref:Uncharacterized protein n=1 Tax=Paramarasmius palmivorus TaxID=297713 RepID=A0AAW0B4P2_9AGAR